MEQLADLTIVMPVYNEKDSIKPGLLQLKEKLKYPFILKIIYDFETDNTLPPIRELAKVEKINIELIRNKYGRGVLAAIKTGIETTTTEFGIEPGGKPHYLERPHLFHSQLLSGRAMWKTRGYPYFRDLKNFSRYVISNFIPHACEISRNRLFTLNPRIAV